MNSVDITIESIDLNTKVHARIECETLEDVIDVITRIEGFGGFLRAGPSATLTPPPVPAPEPKTPIPPLSRKGHAWTPGCVKEAQALLDQGMAYASVAARVGRTPDGVSMAVHTGHLILPLDHPRRTQASRRPQIFKPNGRAPQGELRLARPEDVRPAIDTMRASGAL